MGLSAESSSVDSNAGCEAVSPLSQTFCTPLLSLCVQAIFELEGAIDVSSAKQAITNTLLPGNPRFRSKMTENRHGVLHWVETEVNVDDHVIVPEFPPGQTEYDEFVKDYISTIHLTPLPKCRPMWAFHILNYNTSKARSTLIINMHHSLGHGTSLMSLLLHSVTRADDPNLPLTFPSFMKSLPRKRVPIYYLSSWISIEFMYFMLHRLLFMPLLVLWCTLCDLISSFLRIIWTDDSQLPFRGPPGVEMLPKVISSVTLLMEDVKKIKNFVGGTVNDVVMGVIFAGLQRYLETTLSHGEVAKVRKEMVKSRVTGIVFMNTRALSGLKTLLLTVVSYMGSVRLEVIGTKNYVNSDTLAKCFTECFDKMMDAIEGNIVGS